VFDPANPLNELYSRPDYFKVFVSSKMAGGVLVKERAAAAEAAEEFPLARAWYWERDAPAGSYYSEEECVREAGTSDAIVLILEDELTPTTRAEYAAAHAGGATAIILLKEGIERPAAARRFITRARKEAITKPFSDLAELRSAIVDSLWTWTVRAGRTVLLETRQKRAHTPGSAVYENIELLDEDGRPRPLAETVEEAREAAAAGSGKEALESLYYLADVATSAGMLPPARALLAEIADNVPAEMIDRSWEGWIANVRGRLESASRKPVAARASFEHMRQIAISIDDRGMEAIAHQNLGVEASIREDHEAAREHFLTSLTLKRDLGDIYGGVQVVLNLAGVLVGRDRLDSATAVLDDFEPLVVRYRMVDLRSNIEGQRGLIATRRDNLTAAKKHFLESLRLARSTGWVPRQITALQNLGKNAAERGKNREALSWYRKALELALESGDSHQEQIQRTCVAKSFFGLKDWRAAADQFAAAAALAAELGDATAQAEALGDAAACLRNAGEAQAALGLINSVLADPEPGKNPAWRVEQLCNLAEILVDLDESSEALSRLREAANLSDDPRQQDRALQRAAQIALDHPGLAHEAPELLHRALAIHRKNSNGAEWAWQAATMGAMLSETSQAERATEFFALALRVFARSSDRRRAFFTRNDRAIALNRTDQPRAAAADLRACIEIAEELGDRALQFQAQMNLGEVERQRGRLAEAGEHLHMAVSLAEARGDHAGEGAATAILALVRVDEGRSEEADRHYRRALEIGRELRDAALQQSALGGLAGLAYRAGRHGEAERRYRQAIRQGGEVPSINLAEDLSGCVLAMAARGNSEEALIQRLVDMSGVLGWDSLCARQLCQGAMLLYDAGRREEALEMNALAIAAAMRELFVWLPGHESLEGMPTAVFSEVVIWGARWMLGEDDYPELKSRLLDQVRDSLGIDEGLELLVDSLAAAEEVLAEGDTTSERTTA
jgi:tetratricopeptide (TPR) repeat protein